MTKKKDISQENFEKLLNWLDKDREAAGQKYEKIRRGLINVFTARGCSISEELADETIDRVAGKIDSLADSYEGEPILYFYAVGKKVLSEHFRKKQFTEELTENLTQKQDESEEASEMVSCLRTCLKTLTKEQLSLITQYYQGDKQEKIENRKRLTKELGITDRNLRTKAFRIRNTLQKCAKRCLMIKIM